MLENRHKLIALAAGPFLLLALAAAGYQAMFLGRIYPGVSVADINLSRQTLAEASHNLRQVRTPRLVLVSEDPTFELAIDNLQLKYQYEESASAAFKIGRKGSLVSRSLQKWLAATRGINLPLVLEINEESLSKTLSSVSEQLNIPPVEPEVSVDKGSIVVNKGKDGTEIDKAALEQRIKDSANFARSGVITIPVIKTESRISDQEAEVVGQRAQNLIGKTLEIKFEYQRFIYKDRDLVPLLAPDGLWEDKATSVVSSVKTQVDRMPQNARFVFQEGRVKEFAPAKDGITTDEQELIARFNSAVEELVVSDRKAVSFEVPVMRTKPQVSVGEVNDLGIVQLIGRGASRFAGSIPSRIHNITLAAGKLNGVLIKPNETLSFNEALGDVSIYTGYQQAYVIKEGKTVLGDGGGVCQVSTTLFRATLAAGLPIAERRAHSYRVSYYEQDSKPGLDATVYSPTTDLKIKNDTPAHILIQTSVDRKNATLVFELYGTSDGRIPQISAPRVWDVVPAPPPLYQDDPSVPVGTTKQIDFAAPGSKAAFDYKVTRGSEVLQNRTFYSNYRTWQAVYLRGIAPQ